MLRPAATIRNRGTGIRSLFEKSGAKTLLRAAPVCPRAGIIEILEDFRSLCEKIIREKECGEMLFFL